MGAQVRRAWGRTIERDRTYHVPIEQPPCALLVRAESSRLAYGPAVLPSANLGAPIGESEGAAAVHAALAILAFEDGSIREPVRASAVAPAVGICTRVSGSVFEAVRAMAVHDTIAPLPLVLGARDPSEDAEPVLHVHLPLTLISVAVCILQAALAVPAIALKHTRVRGTVRVGLVPVAMLLVVEPLALIHGLRWHSARGWLGRKTCTGERKVLPTRFRDASSLWVPQEGGLTPPT